MKTPFVPAPKNALLKPVEFAVNERGIFASQLAEEYLEC
jgi:hypothetical protein